MPRREYDPTERIGVAAVQSIFSGKFQWIFREQPVSDFGLDAQVEIVKDRRPTGQLIALQIKTGPSYFRRRGENYVYYGNLEHLHYWLRHCLPVFLILHDPENPKTLWQKIDPMRVTITDRRWSIEIPPGNILNEDAKPYFEDITQPDEESERRFRFVVDKPEMDLMRGRDTYFAIEIWVNKSLSVREIKVYFDDPHKDEPDFIYEIMLPWTYDVIEIMDRFFPWLEYDEVYEPEDISGEIEAHILGVWLTDIAEKFLHVEEYFRDGR